MIDLSKLRSLASLIYRMEPVFSHASLTNLSNDNRDEVTKYLQEGLMEGNPTLSISIQTSSGEYANHLAILTVGSNKYTFAKDYQEPYISEINYFSARITADTNGMLVFHRDYPGVVFDVSRILADHQINISKLNVSREQKGENALLVSLTDEEITAEVIKQIEQLPQVTRVISLQ
ncbi:ACT domain-containing protein [Brevibacillus ginsengisoli]|uniref:ACT domain-containing protein n=1 Tax=Brevibacillus ginsengisoli TaxID=363854 RepID=UPI003CF606E0